MGNWRKMTAKAAWGKLSEERYKFKTALERIHEIAHRATAHDASESDAWAALDYIEELSKEATEESSETNDDGCICA
jgi:hypothetical protein